LDVFAFGSWPARKTLAGRLAVAFDGTVVPPASGKNAIFLCRYWKLPM
jgi:hypothetical protein